MNKILLIRNLMLLKKNYLKYLIILTATPMILYLFNVLPYSNETGKIWSSIGLWISSSIMCSYIYIYENVSAYGLNNKNFLINSPISFINVLISSIIVCLIVSFFQLIIAYMLTYSLNNVLISVLNFCLFLLNIFPVILMFISIALFVSLFDTFNIGLFICTLISISIIQFFYLFPLKESLAYDFIPIIGVLLNCALLFDNQSIDIIPLLLMYLISFIFLIGTLFIVNRIIRKRNER